MSKIIHIHAKCNAFEIFEQVVESKAVYRLNRIKSMFLFAKNRNKMIDDKLKVKTVVVNPELPFTGF